MRKLSALFLALLIGFTGIGCDSNSDDAPSVAELMVGNWAVVNVSDDDGDQSTAFAAGFTSVISAFANAGTFSIVVDAVDDASDQTIAGSYSVDESNNSLTLTTSVPGAGSINLNFSYAFNGDDQVTLTADQLTSNLLNVLLGTSLTGTIRITITRV